MLLPMGLPEGVNVIGRILDSRIYICQQQCFGSGSIWICIENGMAPLDPDVLGIQIPIRMQDSKNGVQKGK